MGFICPECGKIFGYDKEAFEKHFREEHPHIFHGSDIMPETGKLLEQFKKEHPGSVRQKRTNPGKPSVNLGALVKSVEDGRIMVRTDWDGGIVFRNVRSKKEYHISPENIRGGYEGWDDEPES